MTRCGCCGAAEGCMFDGSQAHEPEPKQGRPSATTSSAARSYNDGTRAGAIAARILLIEQIKNMTIDELWLAFVEGRLLDRGEGGEGGVLAVRDLIARKLGGG